MLTFFTSSTEHLKPLINTACADYEVKQFSDGELYVKVHEDVAKKDVWIITSTPAPSENFFELFFLLNALMRTGVQKINIIFTYFGYARQSIAQKGEANCAQVICDFLKMFPLAKTYVLHVHAAPVMHNLLHFTDIIDMSFFCDVAKDYDAIAAPDKGAVDFAQKIADAAHKDIVFVEKMRPAQEEVKIESIDGNVVGKKILLVDDIIATGNTITKSAQALLSCGAAEVSAAATHGTLSDDACCRLTSSLLNKIYVTNSVHQKSCGKIVVKDISSFIESVVLQEL